VNPDQAFGGQPSSWVPKMSTFLNTQGCLQQSVVITPKWLPFVGEESSYICWLVKNNLMIT